MSADYRAALRYALCVGRIAAAAERAESLAELQDAIREVLAVLHAALDELRP